VTVEHEEPLLLVPVVHGRMECAKRVRRALEGARPDAVAVEIPETLAEPFARAVARLPLLSILRWRESGGRFAYLLVEPADPAVEAARWALENRAELCCADRDTEGYTGHRDLVPDSWALERIPADRWDELARAGAGPPDPEDERREETMAFHVRRLLDEGRRVALVCGAAHGERVRGRALDPAAAVLRPIGRVRREVELFHLADDAAREVLSEPPFLQAAFERWRAGASRAEPSLTLPAPDAKSERRAQVVALVERRKRARAEAESAAASIERRRQPAEEVPAEPEPERWQLCGRLARAAKERLSLEDGERIATAALAVLARMARNWARLEGRLSPTLVELVTCARGVGGDDFAFRYWELATSWPWTTASPGLPVLRPSVEDLYQNAAQLRFRLTQKGRRHLLRLVPPRPREKRTGEWKDGWRGESIVSWPPEDLVIEGYGAFLKKRAVGILSSEQSRVEPFTTSLRDGIDLRETIRNLAHDGRIWVREERAVKGEVGAVVLIFDEDAKDERYPWKMTWQGEHAEESDMALFATPPGEKLVGPGISRCEYGGLLLTLPPGRMFQVWEDPFFEPARSKAERLLLAGIDYSLEKLIVYVAAHPPRTATASFAARRGKKVVYVPIGQLSPIQLKRVRVFHVLDGRRVRAHAKDYIRP
jgi:predicted DCC family thiol-disulfide oxidoreductase YuxK